MDMAFLIRQRICYGITSMFLMILSTFSIANAQNYQNPYANLHEYEIGIYGNVWRDWIVENRDSSAFDFIILQYRMQFDDFESKMKKIEQSGKKTFIVLQSFDEKGKRIKGNSNLLSKFSLFKNAFYNIISSSNSNNTIGFSIGEENPPSNSEYMIKMYNEIS